MIDLYYWTTPNGHKITMFLEEAKMKYRLIPVNIGKGEQFDPTFLQIAPNNRIPAMVDYVNHLARMQVLAAPGPFQGYVVTWRLAPNLAMDLIVPLLGRIMPIDIAARLFLAVTYMLVVGGAMALERADP